MNSRSRPVQHIQKNHIIPQTDHISAKDAVLLRDGTPVVIRPARPSDARAILAMHERLSLETVRLRYFGPRTPSIDEISQTCQLTDNNGGALVATLASKPDTIIGMGYFIIDKNQPLIVAEPAFLVEDAYQGQGLGRLLFQQICRYAILSGVQIFEAMVDPANRRMLRTFRNSGFPYEDKISYGTRELQIWLTGNNQVTGDKQ